MVIECLFINLLNQQEDNTFKREAGSKLTLNFIF